MFDPFGRIAFIICVLLAIKFIGRVSKNKKLNKALLKIHEPLGIAAIALGTIHSVISIIISPQEIVANISGILALMLIAFLAVTFYARKNFKFKWLKLHRITTVLLMAILIPHVVISAIL